MLLVLFVFVTRLVQIGKQKGRRSASIILHEQLWLQFSCSIQAKPAESRLGSARYGVLSFDMKLKRKRPVKNGSAASDANGVRPRKKTRREGDDSTGLRGLFSRILFIFDRFRQIIPSLPQEGESADRSRGGRNKRSRSDGLTDRA